MTESLAANELARIQTTRRQSSNCSCQLAIHLSGRPQLVRKRCQVRPPNFTSGKKVQPFKILHVEIMFLFNQLSYYEPTVHSNSILYMTLMFLSGCG